MFIRKIVDTKGIIKSATGLLLSVALLLSRALGGSFPALAVHGADSMTSRTVSFQRETDAAALLTDGMLTCAEEIDLAACSLPVSQLSRVYTAVLHSHPELFHVAARISYTYRMEPSSSATGEAAVATVVAVYPVYTLTGEALTAARSLYRDTVEAILAEMEAAFRGYTPTEAETVLYLHDLLADRYAYDTRAPGAGASANADAFTFFRDGYGICQAYALAFLALCRGAGLEADLVTSDAMDHAWNHVRVDGVWYHVDVTRDDPIPAAGGSDTVTHDRVLRSDAGMAALGYHDFSCVAGHACTDTSYETADGGGTLTAVQGPLLSVLREQDGTLSRIGFLSDGLPVRVCLTASGATVGAAGDMDGDNALTPADLLAVCDPSLPELLRQRLREALVSGGERDSGR